MHHVDAEAEVYGQIAELIGANHPELHAAGATILCQMHRSKAGLKLHGYPCYATAKVVPAKDRAAGMRDARITVDAGEWEGLDDDRRRGVLDHELRHFEAVGKWVFEKEEVPGRPGVFTETRTFVAETDDCGRPRIRMRLHDVQLGWFRAIAERHGAASVECEQARDIVDARGQLLFPWAPAAGARERDSDSAVVRDALVALVSVGHAEPEARALIDAVTAGGARFERVADLIDAILAAGPADRGPARAAPRPAGRRRAATKGGPPSARR